MNYLKRWPPWRSEPLQHTQWTPHKNDHVCIVQGNCPCTREFTGKPSTPWAKLHVPLVKLHSYVRKTAWWAGQPEVRWFHGGITIAIGRKRWKIYRGVRSPSHPRLMSTSPGILFIGFCKTNRNQRQRSTNLAVSSDWNKRYIIHKFFGWRTQGSQILNRQGKLTK